MATTVPGGAYLSADGKTWHDANGNIIAAPKLEVLPAPEFAPLADAPAPEKSNKPKGNKPK